MASLNVNDNVLTIFDGDCSYVFEIYTNSFKKLTCPSSNTALKCSQDPYLGLTRYCSTLSNDGKMYAVARGRDLIIWSTSDWIVRSSKQLERAASKIMFIPSDEKILVADKTGDVYSFSVLDDSTSKGVLLMGHLSILLDITMTPDEKFIITCDRDEKIRITRYPQTYEIERYCLGHLAFVTKVVLLNSSILLSGSGDGSLRFWKFLEGECISTYDVNNEVNLSNDQCIITNVVILSISGDMIICISVHKFDGVLVYHCNLSDFSLKHVQTINCEEPLDIVTFKSFLWILKFSPSRSLNVFMWDESSGIFVEFAPLQNFLNTANANISYLNKCSEIDLTVLCKMYTLKEKLPKKIKTG